MNKDQIQNEINFLRGMVDKHFREIDELETKIIELKGQLDSEGK